MYLILLKFVKFFWNVHVSIRSNTIPVVCFLFKFALDYFVGQVKNVNIQFLWSADKKCLGHPFCADTFHTCIDSKLGSASGGQFAFPALECVYRASWTPELAPGAAGTRRHTSFPQVSDLGRRRLAGPPDN